MIDLILNQNLGDAEQRKALFAGRILIRTGLRSCAALCDLAFETLQEKFDTAEPQFAFRHIPVEEFVSRAEATKNQFTNNRRSWGLIREYVREVGLEPDSYYFDVPRVRVVPTYEYLHAGVSYAYAPHRDTWYGGPVYSLNHWMPLMAIEPEQTMAVYPEYFRRPIKNSSSEFDLSHWVNVERKRAVHSVHTEERPHPLPLEEIDVTGALRLAGNKGDIMVFSGAHLHATVPNKTNMTRFSVDFRLFHVDDVHAKGAVGLPENVDCRATSEDFGMSACFRLSDFSPFRRIARD